MKKKFSLLMVALLGIVAFATAAFRADAVKLIDYPTSQDGIAISGTTEFKTVKIHENKDAVACITLANGYTTEGALNANVIKLTVDGGFKAGDIVTIAGAFNNTDESKVSKVDIFTVDEDKKITVLYTTDQFVNGRLSADEPVAENYTLEADAAELYLGRNGNTGTNITLLTVTRPAGEEPQPVTSTKTVYFMNEDGWETVYVWAWNDDDENFTGGTWPGVEITADEAGLYSWSTEGNPTKIIFSNGSVQTADLDFENGATYTPSGKYVPGQTKTTFTATFKNSIGWETVYAYTFNGEELGNWPGTAMTKNEETGVWTISFEAYNKPANIIFNNGNSGEGNQTEDFEFVDGQEYDMAAPVEPVQGIIPDGTYYVMNANAEPSVLINAEGKLDAKGAPITIVFNAENGTYSTQGAGDFDAFAVTIAEAYEGMSGFYTISVNNMYLTANADGTAVTLGADGTADAAVWIILDKAYWEDIVNSTYTVAGTKNLTGTENDWDVAEANQMTLNDKTGLFEKTFKKIAINAENQPAFKVVKKNMDDVETWYPLADAEGDHNWNITTDYVGGEGVYDITITFDPSDFKEIGVIAKQRIVFPEDAIVFDFEAAADAGENPANKNGNQNLGQGFYGWEKADKTDSKRNDYKGYEWAEGSVLPEVCQVWRRSDRINGNVKDGGLYCPSDKEMAIDGLEAGDKVIIVYDAENATNKNIIWAIGDGSSAVTEENPVAVARATATINGVEAVTGETTIASGAEILLNSVTPAENGTGYIVFQVKKGMVIQQIAIIKAPAQPKYYLVGSMTEWKPNADYMLTLNTEAGEGIVEYMITKELEAEAKFKIAMSADGETIADNDWYPSGMDNDYVVTESANYTIYFRPAGNSEWENGFFFVQKNTTDGINTVKAETLKNAEIYNLAGQRVMNAQKGLYIVNGKKVVLK